jgi:hypothetical protein
VRALTRAPMTESAPVSRRHLGPFCASPTSDLLAAWSLFLVFLLFVSVRVRP